MSTFIVVIHALAASGVILLPPVQILRRRKDNRHRAIGRSWVVLMYVVCVSGMFIYSLSGGFTFFHALAIFTFFTTTLGFIAIRRGIVPLHVCMMVGSWLGAVTAGVFAVVVPGRDIPQLAVHDPAVLWTLVGLALVCVTVWLIYVFTAVPSVRVERAPVVENAGRPG